jgi:hypothetical protein
MKTRIAIRLGDRKPVLSVSAGAFVGFLALAFSAACSSPTKESPAVADAGEDAAPPVSSAPEAPSGSYCTSVSETYSTCEFVSLCPGLMIDPNQFPQCGYAVHGDVIDPECLCYGEMCPMGAPATCADMANILASTTVATVCAEYTGGHCQSLGGQGATSPCQQCQINCHNVVSCLQNCGC